MKKQTRNTEVQINEEETGTLPKKNSSLPTEMKAQVILYMKLNKPLN